MGPKEMLMSFKKSVRGGIRQSPNVITWIQTLQNLKSWGCGRQLGVRVHGSIQKC
jgi:hypothetical protein